jgi:hypothetical protein
MQWIKPHTDTPPFQYAFWRKSDARVAVRPCRPSVCPAGPTFTATFLNPEVRPLMLAATQNLPQPQPVAYHEMVFCYP